MYYFSTAPKTKKEDLFDREAELAELLEALKGDSRLILLVGMRRVGKTSLLKVALNELGRPHIYLDMRALRSYADVSFYELLSDGINEILPLHKRLLDHLKNVRGVAVSGFTISFDLKYSKPSILQLLKGVNQWAKEEGLALPIIFDEAQELRYFRGRVDIARLIAYSYDNLENVKFVLTGSEVGLLYSTLNLFESSSPLYGRHRKLITLNRFDRDLSAKFLREGFKQKGLQVDDTLIEYVVDKLDGIVGWLAYVGAEIVSRVKKGGKVGTELVERAVEEAVELVEDEVKKLPKTHIMVLQCLADGAKRWSEIKTYLTMRAGRTFANPQLANILDRLMKLSMVGKENDRYFLLDNLLGEAARRVRGF